MKKSATFRKLNIRGEYRKNKKFRFSVELFGVIIGAFICGFTYPTFCAPAGIIPSGLTGLCVIIANAMGIPNLYSVVYIILNVVLFLTALKLFGWKFIVFTLVGMGCYTLAIQFFAVPGIVDAIQVPNTNPIEVRDEYRLLYCLIGGAISGVGQGIAFRVGGSTGGSDIAANIINKIFPKIKTGVGVLIINFIVVATTIIYTQSWIAGLYAVIFSVISTITCDMVLDGKKTVKAFYIICDKDQEIAEKILKRFNRGVTVIPAQGKFSGKEKRMLLCLVASYQAREMKEIVKDTDKNAFVFSTSVTETLGDGYFMKEASVKKNKISNAPPISKAEKAEIKPMNARPKKVFGKKFKSAVLDYPLAIETQMPQESIIKNEISNQNTKENKK